MKQYVIKDVTKAEVQKLCNSDFDIDFGDPDSPDVSIYGTRADLNKVLQYIGREVETTQSTINGCTCAMNTPR